MSMRYGTARAFPRPAVDPVATKVPFAFVHINKCGGTGVELALGIAKEHKTASELREHFGADDWANRFKFSIVRNPFDRAISIYFFRVRTNQRGLGDRHLNINQWIDRVWNAEDTDYIGHPLLIAPAETWLCDDGELMVDKVLKLENLNSEWSDVADQLGITIWPQIVNQNLHPDYRDVLTSASRKTLEREFGADLDRFGYRY